MARNRMLSPEFWLDEDLARLSAHARLLYQGLWGICDDHHATLPNRPEWIKAQVFPYEDVNIQQLLTELSESGRIVLFLSENKEYWHVKNFFKYQRVEKPSKSKYPEFEAKNQLVGEESGNTPAKEKLSKEKLSKVNILAKPSAVAGVDPINRLISLFDKVNPSYKTLYSNKTQRGALDRMLKEHGSEKLKWAISSLKQVNTMQYAPVITSPLELEKKLGQLIAFLQKKKGESPKIAVIS